MPLISLWAPSISDQNVWSIDIPDDSQILYVAQWEFWYHTPESTHPITHVETSWIGTCIGVAGYNPETRGMGIAHLDDGLNIPASIHLMRKTLKKFFLLTTLWDDALLEFVSTELQRVWWEVLGKYNTEHYAPTLGSLIINVSWEVYHSSSSVSRDRKNQLEKDDWLPISLLWIPKCVPTVRINKSNHRKPWRETYINDIDVYESWFLHDPLFRAAVLRWEEAMKPFQY